MKVLKIKKSINGKCWFNYGLNFLVNTPRYVVELSQDEFDLLVKTIKERNK